LDIGCGPGVLFEALVQPPSTRLEDPIRPVPQEKGGQLPSPADSDLTDPSDIDEVFIEVSRVMWPTIPFTD